MNSVPGYQSVDYYSVLPNGSSYRLDAEIFQAEDLDGLMEGLLGSGNLNHLVLQADRIGGLADPVSSSTDIIGDDATAAPATTQAPRSGVPITDDDIEAANRSDGSSSDTAVSNADGGDQRSNGQPVEVMNVAGSSETFIAGGDQPTAVNVVPTGGDEVSEASDSPESNQGATPPTELPTPDVETPPRDRAEGDTDLDLNTDVISGENGPVDATIDVTVDVDPIENLVDDIDVELQITSDVSDVADLIGLGVETVDPGTVEEAVETTLETLDELVSEDGIVDETLDAVDDLTDDLSIVDDTVANLDVTDMLDVPTLTGGLGIGRDEDPGDNDLVVDINQGLIDVPLVGDGLRVDVDPIENLVGDIDVEVGLEVLDPTPRPGDGPSAIDVTEEIVDEVEAVISPIVDEAADVPETAVEAVQAMIEDGLDAVSDPVSAPPENVEPVVEETANIAEGVTETVADMAEPAIEEIETLVDESPSAVQEAVSSADILVEELAAEELADVADGLVDILPGIPDDADTDLVMDADLGLGEQPPAEVEIGFDPVEAVVGDVDVEVAALDVPDDIGGDDVPAEDVDEALDEAVSDVAAALAGGENDDADTDLVMDADLGLGELPLAEVEAEVGLDPVEAVVGDVDVDVEVAALDVPDDTTETEAAEEIDTEENNLFDMIVSEIEVDLDTLEIVIEEAESSLATDGGAETDDALGTLEEGTNEIADLATSASDAEVDGLPEPSGLISEGIGLLADIQPDQPVGGSLFG